MMRFVDIAVRWLFVLCLPVMIFTASIAWAVNSQWFYEYGFEKYGVSQTTGLASSELHKAASGLISYFNSGEEFINLTVIKDGKPFALFNEREIIHLKDFKGLIQLDYRVLLGTGIFVLVYAVTELFFRKKERRRLARAVITGGGVTLGLILFLGLWALVDFDGFFLQLHLISFANNFWLLDPTKDYLIMLFPEGFWYDVTMFCVLLMVGMAVVLSGAAGGYLLASRRKARLMNSSTAPEER